MISKQQFDMCVRALNNGGAFVTHRGYYGIRTSEQSGVRQIGSEVFSAVLKYCGGKANFQVTDTRTQFGIESTWELIDPVHDGELPEFARTDIDSNLTKTPEFKKKVDDVKKSIKNAFGCTPYERKNSAKYTLLKFWADSEVDMSKLENVISMFSDVSAKQVTRREFNITIYPDTKPKLESADDLMEALNRAHLLDESTTSETTYEDWDDVYFAIEGIIESCTIFGRHPYWFDAYTRPDRLILDIGVDDDDTGRTGSHYEATLANLDEVPTNTNELIQYVENLSWKATGETDVDDEYDLDDNM